MLVALLLSAAGSGVLLGAEKVARELQSRAAYQKLRDELTAASGLQAPRYCELAKQLAQTTLFRRQPGGRDAGELLNSQSPENPIRRGSLVLKLGEAWLDARDDLPDTTWMSRMGDYGRWSLVTGLPAAAPPIDPLSNRLVPWPLSDWAKVRLLRAMRDGDFRAASAEVQQLAFLTMSTGDSVMLRYGQKMLRVERQAYERAVADGRDVTGWNPIASADLDLAERLDRATLIFASPWVTPSSLRKVLQCSELPAFRGVLLSQAITSVLMLRTLRPSEVSDTLKVTEEELGAPQSANVGELARAYLGPPPGPDAEPRSIEVARRYEVSLDRSAEDVAFLFRPLFERWIDWQLTRQRAAMAGSSPRDADSLTQLLTDSR